ncbi:MAG TPA: hypothetical protein VHX88_08800 [Solirubrobacteraceae bacterium]|jgi:hypothetical protein|nr:hypothetical protein [Solirubrobacteraceae bacterium]
MPAPATAFVHVEVVHPDPDGAAAFIIEELGGERVERGISSYLEGLAPEGELQVIHVRLGNVVFQLVKPPALPGLESWYEQLRDHGPSVHNVTVFVDGVEDVRQRLLARGATQAAELDLTLQDAGLDVQGTQKVHVLDAREQTGLRFELLETIPSWVPGKGP